jgi:DNA polymerase III subunit gamma/tau
MFGNIVGQDNVINLLKNDFIKKSFNNSMIFHGEESTGKLTTALELTRVLNCIYHAESECQCSNCLRIRSLDFEGLIFLSRRNFYFYLKEYIETYKNTKNYKYIKNIKNILKLIFLPLQDYLVQDVFSESDKKIIINESENVSKIISKNEFHSADLDDILNISKEIFELYKKPNIPIDTIRGMLDWTYINRPNINKVVIIDQVDFLEESSRNILLKRLEEPSPNLFFILIAENKNRIIETIKSRCRSYYFQKISSEKTMEILSVHLRNNQDIIVLKTFYLEVMKKVK